MNFFFINGIKYERFDCGCKYLKSGLCFATEWNVCGFIVNAKGQGPVYKNNT